MQVRLPHSRHATVVGAGLLGVEAAVGLQAQGLQVTLMHRNPVLMNRQLDSTAAQLLHNALRQRGIQVRTGCGPEQLLSDNGPGNKPLAVAQKRPRYAPDLSHRSGHFRHRHYS